MIFNERPENIFIYHFVEELMSDYGTYYEFNLKEDELTLKEYSILLKIRYEEVTSQHDLVKMFKVSNAYQEMINSSAAKRVGTSEEIARAAEFLLNDDSSFITGIDLLIDGGVIASIASGKYSLELQ